jgi:5'-phosphate synthase pdxT subunit
MWGHIAASAPQKGSRVFLKVGILALQGDITPHRRAVERLGHHPELVRYPQQLETTDALIMPGGESTTIQKLLDRWELADPIRRRAGEGMPIWGTCAGAILLARSIRGSDQPTLGLMDAQVERNAYGRQVDSFEAEVTVEGMEGSMRAVFIRAPIITHVGPTVRVLAIHEGAIVAAAEGHLLATTFHPELADDDRLLQTFLDSPEGLWTGRAAAS